MKLRFMGPADLILRIQNNMLDNGIFPRIYNTHNRKELRIYLDLDDRKFEKFLNKVESKIKKLLSDES